MDELEGLVTEVARKRISRRQFIDRALALGLSAGAIGTVLGACGGETESSPSPGVMDTTKPEKLYLFNWAEYMDPALLKKFEQETGIKVVETYYDDNEALLSKLKAGARGYDLCVPSDYMVTVLYNTGLLLPLDMKYIPNFKYVAPRWQKPAYDPETDGNKYSCPYQFGTTGIGVRIDKVTEPITKWADLWNPAYKGQIEMLNDERDVIGAALLTLGYSLNCRDQGQFDEGVAKAIEQKPLVRAYNSNTTRRDLTAGVPLVQGWTGYVLMAYDALGPERLDYVLAEEGFCMYMDSIAIPIGAPSPYAAHLFLNFLFDPKNAAQLTNYTWYHTPVPDATQYIDKMVLAFVPTDQELQRGEQLVDLGEFTRNWADGWAKLKSA